MEILRRRAVSVKEAAELLSVSPRTIYRLIKSRRLRTVRITADSPRVLLAGLDEFVSMSVAEVATDVENTAIN